MGDRGLRGGVGERRVVTAAPLVEVEDGSSVGQLVAVGMRGLAVAGCRFWPSGKPALASCSLGLDQRGLRSYGSSCAWSGQACPGVRPSRLPDVYGISMGERPLAFAWWGRELKV